MRELREDTFLGNKNGDTHEHVEKVLDIFSIFNIPGVTHDAVMLRVFPITLTGAVKRWFDMIPLGTINTWDLLEKAFIQRYCPPSKTAKQLEEIHNFKQEGGQEVVGYAVYEGAHLDKDWPLNEEVKKIEEVKYGKFGRSFPNNGGNRARCRESTRRRNEKEEWMKKLQENTDMNIRNQNTALKNLETQVEQLKKDFQANAAKEAPSSSALIGHCKVIFADNDTRYDETSSNEPNKLHGLYFMYDDNVQISKKENEGSSGVLPCQLPLKELSLGSFTLPCTIGSLNMYTLADLGASVNVTPYSMFKCLKLTSLKETSMLFEMADMSKKAPMGIVENVLVKIDKFVFPYDFVVINMLGDPNETVILGRSFLATIHAQINFLSGEISLGIGEYRIMFDINKNVHHPTIPIEKVYMASFIQEEESFNPLEIGDDLFLYDSPMCLEFEKYNHLYDTNESNEDTFVDDVQEQITGRKGKTKKPGMTTLRLHSCKLIWIMGNDTCKFRLTCDPNLKECNGGDSIYGINERKISYGNSKIDDTTRKRRYDEWFAKNYRHGSYESTSRSYLGNYAIAPDFIILDMLEDIKVPLFLGRPFLSTARAKIDVYKRRITFRVGEEKIIFKSVKPASSIIKRVYMLSLRERMELDLEARLMGETLVLNRSLDPFLEDYIKLNDLNEPFELRRNQGGDLMPTIKEGEAIEEFRTRDEDLDAGINDYPSYCDDDKKIHIDCAHNLKFSCMIGFEFTHANFFLLLYVNMMSKKFHNSIMKDKMMYKGNIVVGALMNVPIFVGTFSIMTDFVVLEDMDAYRDEGMGDVIFREPFLREVGIKTKRFEGIITIYNGGDKVTYQMVRSHPRFKNHTNEQCNKIPPLLKVSEVDKKNGISHAY
ncbi:homeodomain-like protein [Tanacetum coccineum]